MTPYTSVRPERVQTSQPVQIDIEADKSEAIQADMKAGTPAIEIDAAQFNETLFSDTEDDAEDDSDWSQYHERVIEQSVH